MGAGQSDIFIASPSPVRGERSRICQNQTERYSADDRTRERWRRDFPKMKVPPHEDPPFQRDRMLPRPANNG